MSSFFQRTVFGVILFGASGLHAMAGGVHITNYGHSALLIKGGGESVLLNPFKAIGCAAGLNEPRIRANVILASSDLADEGARVAKGVFLVDPGSYRVRSLKLEGFTVPHDRLGGRRYGLATLWQWTQGGLRFAHLGSGIGPLSDEDKVLLGKTDVLIISVGGGAKAYNANEAVSIIQDLKPKRIIPVQYSRGKPSADCDQTGIDPFLEAMEGTPIKKVGRTFTIKTPLRENTVINLMH